MKKDYNILQILRSCITGTAVWIYRGPSREAARKAYWRACRREAERVRGMAARAAQRKANIMRLLNDCLAGQPITADLPPEKRAAARRLLAIADEKPVARSEFYNHFMEERRRRKKEREQARRLRNS